MKRKNYFFGFGRASLFLAILVLLIGVVGLGEALAGAVISNGTIQLGVNDQGHLNIAGAGSASFSIFASTTDVGLRYVPNNTEATAPGCLCEGWGAGVASLGVSGYANVSVDGVVNLSLVSFASTATTATSVVTIADGGGIPIMRVTHDYHPTAATSNLYEVDVTIANISGAPLGAGPTDIRYRRVMDWDVGPTEFSEFVTIAGWPATNLLATRDDGFDTANPLSTFGPLDLFGCGFNSNFTDCGPDDHGALFDFGFLALGVDESVSFNIYYGAAGTETAALSALAAVSAEVFSLGQCDSSYHSPCSETTGTINTFIFGFKGVGGAPVADPIPEPATLFLLGTGLAGLGFMRRRKRV